MNILGLNAFHGDASAALLSDGQLVAALEEERLNRDEALGWVACAGCKGLSAGNATGPHRDFAQSQGSSGRQAVARSSATTPVGRPQLPGPRTARGLRKVGEALAAEGIVSRDRDTQVHFVEHHRAHLASAFFASPFEEAAVISIDGFGDFSSVMWGLGKGNQIEVRGSVSFPHSLGIFYTAFTQFLGFPKYGDEYKMMGLSAYGEPRFAEQVRRVVRHR